MTLSGDVGGLTPPLAPGQPVAAGAAMILAGWLHVPKALLPAAELDWLRQTLVFRTRPTDDQPARTVPLFAETRDFILVPPAFGLARYPGLPLIDRTTLGDPVFFPRRPDPYHPNVREPERQARFMADLIAAAHDFRTFNAEAETGTGKSICGLNLAAELGRRTLVMVHVKRIARHWLEEARDKLGVPTAELGAAAGERCDWQGKTLVAATVQSLAKREYPPAFYQAFGLVICDEVHRLGSPFFSQAIHKFPARYRVGLSATMKRRDSGSRVYHWHLGPVRVTSEATALPIEVHVLRYGGRVWGRTHGARVLCLRQDMRRNHLLTSVIVRFQQRGRQGLVVSDSIAHLHLLHELALRQGVPAAAIGLFTGEVKRSELARVKRDSQLVLATYGMIKEGVDIPRLDAGLDATPRNDATQLIGRLRRPLPGKPVPIWVTLLDTACPTLLRYFERRCADYRSSGARISHHGP